jgi:N-acetylmuramoyl-L-alanine amidase
MAKMKFLLFNLVLGSFFLFISSGNSQDLFIDTINAGCDLNLVPEKLTNQLNGYKILPFPEEQKNRNHFDDRPEGILTPIKSLVMHYTVLDIFETLSLFTKNISEGRVSSSYVITESDEGADIKGGQVIQVAPDDKRTWHGGVSKWREINNLNGTSIGIENVNKGFLDHPQPEERGAEDASKTQILEREWFSFDPDQIQSLGLLSQALIKKYNISPVYVVGHADIASQRKQDPGILFPWGHLFETYGVGAWLTEEERSPSVIMERYKPTKLLPPGVDIKFLSKCLKKYGYNVVPTPTPTEEFLNVLKAFKSHFSRNQQPERYNDEADENDMVWAWGLISKYKPFLV